MSTDVSGDKNLTAKAWRIVDCDQCEEHCRYAFDDDNLDHVRPDEGVERGNFCNPMIGQLVIANSIPLLCIIQHGIPFVKVQ